MAKKRRKVDSETNKYLAIAAFGLPASSMSAISSHSCGVGCQHLLGIATHYGPARSRRKIQHSG